MIRKFESKTPQVSESCFVADSALVLGDVVVGEHTSIWYGAIVRGDVFHIRLGARTNIQDRTVIHVTTGRHATIVGDDVTVGHAALLHGCQIGSGVLVGMAAVVMDAVEVGDGCLIAAGSLLPPGKRYPAGSLIMGNPGRVVRETTDEERAGFLASAAHYVTLAGRHMQNNSP